MSWSIVSAPTGFYSWEVEPDTFYVFRGLPTGTDKWTVEADTFYVFRGTVVGTDLWSEVPEPTDAFYEGWRSWLNPFALPAQSFLSVAEAPEDFDVDPEDLDLEPEFVQDDNVISQRFYNDSSGWTITAGYRYDD